MPREGSGLPTRNQPPNLAVVFSQLFADRCRDVRHLYCRSMRFVGDGVQKYRDHVEARCGTSSPAMRGEQPAHDTEIAMPVSAETRPGRVMGGCLQ